MPISQHNRRQKPPDTPTWMHLLYQNLGRSHAKQHMLQIVTIIHSRNTHHTSLPNITITTTTFPLSPSPDQTHANTFARVQIELFSSQTYRQHTYRKRERHTHRQNHRGFVIAGQCAAMRIGFPPKNVFAQRLAAIRSIVVAPRCSSLPQRASFCSVARIASRPRDS